MQYLKPNFELCDKDLAMNSIDPGKREHLNVGNANFSDTSI